MDIFMGASQGIDKIWMENACVGATGHRVYTIKKLTYWKSIHDRRFSILQPG